jgi:hypothetical protein
MKDKKKDSQEKRMSLEDFKLSKFESENEIEKMLGEAAGDCHKTSCLSGNPCIEILDISWNN